MKRERNNEEKSEQNENPRDSLILHQPHESALLCVLLSPGALAVNANGLAKFSTQMDTKSLAVMSE